MAIKHVLLAILAEEPTHGYELKKRIDETLGSLWSLQQAQIYNNLRLLEKAELIELDARIAQANLPDQKHFRLTETGQTELTSWLSSPVPSNRQFKDDFYLKLITLIRVCCPQKPPSSPKDPAVVHQQLNDLLWQQREAHLRHLRGLEKAFSQAEIEGDIMTATLLEGAILHTEADLTWLDRCEERLPAVLNKTNGENLP